MKYSSDQIAAIRNSMVSGMSIINGGPGVGKSTVIDGLLKIYHKAYPSHPIYLAAPTGRAAKRMAEVTGLEAKTIHRLLKYNPEFGGFIHREDDKLRGPGLMVIDESSMMDISLAHSLLQAVETGIQVVLVGDIDQLPSVGPGAVLRDSIESGAIPTVRLNYNYRQAAGSGIALYANQVNKGQWEPPDSEDIVWIRIKEKVPAAASEMAALEVVNQAIKAVHDGLHILDWQVLSPQRKGAAGVTNLNEVIRAAVNPQDGRMPELKVGKQIWRLGDKVLVTKNDYKLLVFNGDLGVITEVVSQGNPDYKRQGLVVTIDDNAIFFNMDALGILDLAYCTTVHKCVSLDTLIETDQGLMRIEAADSGCVAAIDGAKEFTRTPVLPEKEMLQITTRDGYRVTVTPDHGIDAWDGEKYCRVEAKDLSVGNFLQIGLGSRIEPKNIMPLPCPQKGNMREKIFAVPDQMTPELAEFIGLMVADGTIFKRGFRLAKRHDEVADRFSDLCLNLFGATPKRWEKDMVYYSEISSVYLSRWLLDIGGMAPNQKGVSQYILSGSSDHYRPFLRGLFEDGGVNLRTENPGMVDHIDFTTCHERLASDVQIMLARLGIVSCHKRNSGKHKYSKVYIYGEYARLFGKEVGFITREKQRRSTLEAGSQTNYVIPVSKSERIEIYHAKDSHFSISDRGNARNRGYISRSKYHNMENIPAWLAERCASHHDRIKSIEKVFEKSTCLNVPDGHRFLQNAISGWNSQGSEFRRVITVVMKSHHILLQKNLVYTAFSRARKELVIIAQDAALKYAVDNDQVADRFSLLRQRLQQE